MIESILGGVLGGVLRVVPEVLKWLDRKGERDHELRMLEKEIELTKYKLNSEFKRIEMAGDIIFSAAALDTLRAGITAQSKATGLAGQLSGLVRPLVTYAFFLIWASIKVTAFLQALPTVSVLDALMVIWTQADQAVFAGILNFWFLGRVFEKVLDRR